MRFGARLEVLALPLQRSREALGLEAGARDSMRWTLCDAPQIASVPQYALRV